MHNSNTEINQEEFWWKVQSMEFFVPLMARKFNVADPTYIKRALERE